jgi:metallo-beta-lactamase class B
MKPRDLILVSLLIPLAAGAAPPVFKADPSKNCDACEGWNAPQEPFRVFGNTYYVGVAGLSAVLIASDQGLILLDGDLPQSALLIDASIRKLGFRIEDLRLIVNSHAHFDHAGGIAALQRASGATVAASASGARALENGAPPADDPQYGFGAAASSFPPVKHVKVVADGEVLHVGPLAITAHLTPGHTPGSTAWTWQSCEGARCLHVVYADSLNPISAPGFRFSGDRTHASVEPAFRRSISTTASLPCDILLAVHPSFAGMEDKLRRRREQPGSEPFIDPSACRSYASDAERRLDQRIAEEQRGDYQVLDYDDEIQVDLEGKQIRGRERIQVRSLRDDLEQVGFPRNGIDVVALKSEDGRPLSSGASMDRIDVRLSKPLRRNEVTTIVAEYRATRPKGVEFGARAAYTSFFTCHWMICREGPDDRATSTLTILGPPDLTVVASGDPVPGSEGLVEGRRRTVWRESTPYSSYLFGFVIGHLTRFASRHGDINLEIYVEDAAHHPLPSRTMFEQTEAALEFFAGKAGQPFPHRSYRQVVVEGDVAQEATSFSILGSKLLSGLGTPSGQASIISHELAHQFWGNLITCGSWADFWLNEGMAVFMAAAFDEHRSGRSAYDEDLRGARERYQFALDAGFDVPIAFAGDYPSLRMKRAIVYSKGCLFLATIRAAMGDGPFWTALATYSRSYAGRLVSSEEFERVFAAKSPVDLGDLFRTWVHEQSPSGARH